MLKKILEAISSLFAAIFGSKPKPDSAPRPKIQDVLPADGSEITPDTVVVVVNEMEHVEIDPFVPDKESEEETPATTGEKPSQVPEAPEEKPAIEPEQPKPEEKPVPAKPKQRFLWCLDNGHGKKTPGKRSPLFDDGKTRFLEYEFNRDVVKRITDQLDQKGIEYFVVVPEVDIDDFLEGRVERANNKKSDIPKIFVSVHSNAAPAPSAEDWGPDSVSGIETWFFHGSKRGQKLASIFHKHLIKETRFKNRNLKSKPEKQFFVLRKTNMTSVLTENGFYNNKKEAAELMKPEVRQKIADAHVAAILEIERNGL